MLDATEALIQAGLANRILRQDDLARTFGGSAQRRYGLVNKALAKGELVRLKRGVYCLAERYRSTPISEFHAAGQVVPNSYVSFESALGFHGWLPEQVVGVQSAICRGRALRFQTEAFGELSYVRISIRPYRCLVGVARRAVNERPFLVADPLRAIGDYVYVHRVDVRDTVGWLEESLRIDPEDLRSIGAEDFDAIAKVYRARRPATFIERLRSAVNA